MDSYEDGLFEISTSESEEEIKDKEPEENENFKFVLKKQEDLCFSVPGGGKLILAAENKDALLEWWNERKKTRQHTMTSPEDKTRWTLSHADNNTVIIMYVGTYEEVKYTISGVEADLIFETYLGI
jgi:hypothetical protein